MDNYIFSASRQLIFFVNINGQQRLVQFGSRNANGSSIFQTTNEKTAEAIRNHSLYRRGVVVEQVEKKPEVKKPEAPKQESHAMGVVTDKPEANATGMVAESEEQGEIIEAKNFTQAKSLLAKRLDIKYNDIKNPDQLMKLAKDAGITIKY